MILKNYIARKRLNIFKLFIFLVLLLCLILNFFNFNNISTSLSRFKNLFTRMHPMDYSILASLYDPIVDTIIISFISTTLGIATTIIFLPFQNNLLFKNKFVPKIISGIFSIFRTIPSLIIATILVSLFSVGNFSGFLSLYIISILMSSKILKEYSEEIDKRYIESLISVGLGKIKIYKLAFIENLKPQIFSIFFLVLESNIRGASVLGLVGAGGIGQILWKELNLLRYDRVAIIVIVLILIIFLIDIISYIFRNTIFKFKFNKKNYYIKKIIMRFTNFIIIFISIYFGFCYLNISSDRLTSGFKHLQNMFVGIISPDLSYLPKVLNALLDSLIVAFSSTALAAITVIITSYFYVKKISNVLISFVFKILINICRTIPPIITAIVFFRGFGPGYLSSFFALYIYTIGIMTKMFGEVLEAIDDNILLIIRSMGIAKFIGYKNILFLGYFPEFLSISLYRFEMNVKNSTILGMVGAGGIGQLFVNNIEFRNWNRISTILIILCLTIISIENISYLIREKIKK